MTPPFDPYDYVLAELEGIPIPEEHLADTYPSDEEVQWAAEAFDAGSEGCAA